MDATGHLARGPNGHLVKRCKCATICQANTTPDSVEVAIADVLFCEPCWKFPGFGNRWGRWNPAPTWTGGTYTLGPIGDCDFQDYWTLADGVVDEYVGPVDCLAEDGDFFIASHNVAQLVIRVGFSYIDPNYLRTAQAWLALEGGVGSVGQVAWGDSQLTAWDCSDDAWGGANDYGAGDCGVTQAIGMYGGTILVDANM